MKGSWSVQILSSCGSFRTRAEPKNAEPQLLCSGIVKTPKKGTIFWEALNLNPNPTPEALNPNPKQFLHPTGLASGAREQHTSAVVLGLVFWSYKVYYRLSNLHV